jgi:hypothetical protein
MTAVPVEQQRKPSETECQMRAEIRAFVTEYAISERGRPIGEVRQNQLARRLAAVVDPVPRPVDVEQPRVPKGAAARAAAIRARQAELPPEPKPVAAPKPKPAPAPLPPLPERLDEELRAVVGLIGIGFSNAAIAGRLGISEQRVKYAVTRAKARLGVSDRKLLAGALAEALLPGGGDSGAESGPVCPPAALDGPIQARGASGAERATEGPSGAFSATIDVPAAQGDPENRQGLPPDGPAGRCGPSGPTPSAEARMEPHGPFAVQAVRP